MRSNLARRLRDSPGDKWGVQLAEIRADGEHVDEEGKPGIVPVTKLTEAEILATWDGEIATLKRNPILRSLGQEAVDQAAVRCSASVENAFWRSSKIRTATLRKPRPRNNPFQDVPTAMAYGAAANDTSRKRRSMAAALKNAGATDEEAERLSGDPQAAAVWLSQRKQARERDLYRQAYPDEGGKASSATPPFSISPWPPMETGRLGDLHLTFDDRLRAFV